MEIDYVGMQEKAAKYNCELTCIESSYRMTKKNWTGYFYNLYEVNGFLRGLTTSLILEAAKKDKEYG